MSTPARWSSVTWPTDTLDPPLLDARIQRLADDIREVFELTLRHENGEPVCCGERSRLLRAYAGLIERLAGRGGMAVEAPEGSARTFVLRLGRAA